MLSLGTLLSIDWIFPTGGDKLDVFPAVVEAPCCAAIKYINSTSKNEGHWEEGLKQEEVMS